MQSNSDENKGEESLVNGDFNLQKLKRLNCEARKLKAAALEDLELDSTLTPRSKAKVRADMHVSSGALFNEGSPPEGSKYLRKSDHQGTTRVRPAWAQDALDLVVKPAGHFFVSMCDLLGGLNTPAVLTAMPLSI